MNSEQKENIISHTQRKPLVSIGMPVYNGAAFIREALDSLLAQTFTDFELIISDNASTDETEAICREYATKDHRIRYIRQSKNRGAAANFQFVLNEGVGEYFMWAAADDLWAPAFLELNLEFLKKNPKYIGAITGVSVHEGREQDFVANGCAPIEDDCIEKRLKNFFRFPGANARFYSLYRSGIVKSIRLDRYNFFGGDWMFVAKLLTYGPIGLSSPETLFNKRPVGLSNDVIKIFEMYRNRATYAIFPFFDLFKGLSRERLLFFWVMLSLIRWNLLFVRSYWVAKARKLFIERRSNPYTAG